MNVCEVHMSAYRMQLIAIPEPIQVRMFQDVELDKLKVKTVNGKETLGEPYNPE